jgi:4-hydroxy-3-methylbut-2-enyl diphosphate reductase
MKIVKAKETGFCYGVRRAIDMLEKAALRHGCVQTLGPVVHNDQVTRRLDGLGIHVINSIQDVTGQVIAISSHGVSPAVEAELRSRPLKLIDTTCPFVRRAQIAARGLVKMTFTRWSSARQVIQR